MLKKVSFKSVFKHSFFICLMGLPFVLVNQYEPEILNSIIYQINDHILFLRLFRWIIILLIFFLWSFLLKKIGKYYDISEEAIAFWLAKRWQIITWLILFELLVCENLILKLIGFLTA